MITSHIPGRPCATPECKGTVTETYSAFYRPNAKKYCDKCSVQRRLNVHFKLKKARKP